jgi:hypothetical protein
MTSIPYKKTQKHIRFNHYQDLRQLEKRLLSFTRIKDLHIQISVLGKVMQHEEDLAINNPNATYSINAYWKTLFGNSVNFGSFFNPEIGNVFIVGALAPTFLYEVNGKPLAMMSSGPYGIFRGLGLGEIDSSMYLKMLINGSYLLIIRASENEIERIT